MSASRALIDELERQAHIVERLWEIDPGAPRPRDACRALAALESEVRHLLLRARCGVSDDDVWAQALCCGRRLDRLRAEWHRDPQAA